MAIISQLSRRKEVAMGHVKNGLFRTRFRRKRISSSKLFNIKNPTPWTVCLSVCLMDILSKKHFPNYVDKLSKKLKLVSTYRSLTT